ncbi:MAG: hypothetical protein IJM64_04205 [Ottowia sp.]|nr:hypothetical protein [Ottowia sp.]
MAASYGLGTTAYVGNNGTGTGNTVSVTSTDYASAAAAGGASDGSGLIIPTGVDKSGTVKTNTLTVESSARVGYAAGGVAASLAAAQADENVLKVLGEVDNAAGGLAAVLLGTASTKDNEVHIEGGKVNVDLYGGVVAAGNGDATGNHVFLVSGAVMGDVWGGKCKGSGCKEVDGNTLHVEAKGLTVGSTSTNFIKNFDTLEFTLPADIKSGEPMLTAKGAAELGTVTSVNIAVNGSPDLAGKSITLVDAGSLTAPTTLSSTYFDVNKDGNKLVATFKPLTPRAVKDVSPQGGKVQCDDEQVADTIGITKCTAIADTGYTYDDGSIKLDGGSATDSCSGDTCELSNVTSDVTLSATFTLNQYTVKDATPAGAGGRMECPSTTVTYFDTPSCEAIPDQGYIFVKATHAGTATMDACPDGICTFTDVLGDVTVTGTFAKDSTPTPPQPDPTPDPQPQQPYVISSTPTLGELGLLLSGLALVGAAAPALRRREKQGKKTDTHQ